MAEIVGDGAPRRLAHLRRTRVRLLDGFEYSFCAVPMGSDLAAEALELMAEAGTEKGLAGRSAKLALLARRAVLWSLSVDQGEEEARRVLNEGVCPFRMSVRADGGGTEEERVAREVLGALGFLGFRPAGEGEGDVGDADEGVAGAGVGDGAE